jgi:predicted  nucleic acid-binding Zn-ribbon protein
VLSLVVFDEHSPPLPPGSRVAGVESELELELKRQIIAAESAVRIFTRQLDDLRQTLDKASRSEEKRKLEDSMDGLVDTLRRTRDDVARLITQELRRWKKLYEKFFEPERDKPVKLVS